MEQLRLQEELKKTRRELLLLYEIGNLIRTTLHLDEIVYLILSAVTSHEGLGFNRAILFMVHDKTGELKGHMGIGPTHPAASPAVWKMIEENKISLEKLLDIYHKSDRKIDPELNDFVRKVSIPIVKGRSALVRAVLEDKPFIVPAAEAVQALGSEPLSKLEIGQFAVLPLRGKERVVGALLLDNVTTKKEIRESDVRRVMMLANHGGLALENAKSFGDIMTSARQDSLTRLWNHGHFQKLLQDAILESRLTRSPLGLLFFDVDDFKPYNDSLGHQAGDKALSFIAETAKKMMRKNDQLARYGGEEFAVILPETDKEEAARLAERLRTAIEKETADKNQSDVPRTVTVSVGVAAHPQDGDDKEKLIYCADAALYEAKRRGKNQIQVYQKPD